MSEPYATRINANGSRTYYRTRADYVAGRSATSASRAAQRARINRQMGGRVV